MNLSTLLTPALLAASLAAAALPASAEPRLTAGVVPLRSTGPGSAWPKPSLRCTGSEAPTVVLDTSGESRGLWTRVLPLLGALPRVCLWNVGAPATPASDAVALRAALRDAGEPGPYLRAAHGQGGAAAAAFAERYPEAVLGLALVDVPVLAAGVTLPDELLLAVVSSPAPSAGPARERLDLDWQDRQAALAGLSTRSFHFVAAEHHRGALPEHDPAAVATALDWLRRQVQLAAMADELP